jgi:NitT/TauT family transport system substrate-binding protein
MSRLVFAVEGAAPKWAPAKTAHVCAASLLTLAVFLSLAASACGGTDRSRGDEPTALRVGVNPFIGNGPIYLAAKRGLCEPYGLVLDLRNTNDPSLLDAQLRTGAIDIAPFPSSVLVRNAAAGLDIQAFLTVDFSAGADGIVSRDGSKSLEELARRKTPIALDVGDVAFFLLMAVGQRVGLGPSDFNISQMSLDAAGAAYIAGRVEAAGLAEPFLSRALNAPDTQLVLGTREFPTIISDLFVARRDVLHSRRDDLAAFARCWYSTLDVAKTDPTATSAIAESLGLSPEEVAAQSRNIRWPSLDAGARYFRDGELVDLLEFSKDLYSSLGLISASGPESRSLISLEVIDSLDGSARTR